MIRRRAPVRKGGFVNRMPRGRRAATEAAVATAWATYRAGHGQARAHSAGMRTSAPRSRATAATRALGVQLMKRRAGRRGIQFTPYRARTTDGLARASPMKAMWSSVGVSFRAHADLTEPVRRAADPGTDPAASGCAASNAGRACFASCGHNSSTLSRAADFCASRRCGARPTRARRGERSRGLTAWLSIIGVAPMAEGFRPAGTRALGHEEFARRSGLRRLRTLL